jgi:thioredoxin 1
VCTHKHNFRPEKSEVDVDVNKDNYEQVVVQPGTPTLVDFWGPQCARCFALMPAVEKLAEENKDRLRLLKIDASKNRRLCLNLRLLSLPSFLFYRDGKEIMRLAGNEVTEKDLKRGVDSLLSGSNQP